MHEQENSRCAEIVRRGRAANFITYNRVSARTPAGANTRRRPAARWSSGYPYERISSRAPQMGATDSYSQGPCRRRACEYTPAEGGGAGDGGKSPTHSCARNERLNSDDGTSPLSMFELRPRYCSCDNDPIDAGIGPRKKLPERPLRSSSCGTPPATTLVHVQVLKLRQELHCGKYGPRDALVVREVTARERARARDSSPASALRRHRHGATAQVHESCEATKALRNRSGKIIAAQRKPRQRREVAQRGRDGPRHVIPIQVKEGKTRQAADLIRYSSCHRTT